MEIINDYFHLHTLFASNSTFMIFLGNRLPETSRFNLLIILRQIIIRPPVPLQFGPEQQIRHCGTTFLVLLAASKVRLYRSPAIPSLTYRLTAYSGVVMHNFFFPL